MTRLYPQKHYANIWYSSGRGFEQRCFSQFYKRVKMLWAFEKFAEAF
jgi:hypothetical protein